MSDEFDIVIVGAGHAGCEAAYASARMGARTLLLTMNLDHIALMSCNPAIGGLAKGHLVREIDAMGGVMGIAADQTGIQFRMLNTSKGPAVRAPRAQSDKLLYSQWMKQFLGTVPNLELMQGTVEKLEYRTTGTGYEVVAVHLQYGMRVPARAVIVTTGTFLDGLIHVGDKSFPAGRAGEPSADSLSRSFTDLGIETGRLKTGTPPRLEKRTINWEMLEPQHGDNPPHPFSFLTEKIPLQQVPCHITYTNQTTHQIIVDNLDRSAMYGGHITSVGPRYCPSIEDKCVRFAEKEHHQLFLEPEGLTSSEIYVNGVSTSLPEDVQRRFINSIAGLEQARLTRVGYAIEYTFCPPSHIYPTMETKSTEGLYFAGQINGTTGYEEAAAQGLIAGVNAVLKIRNQPPFYLRRDQAYIGVLIDDLVTKDHTEPYRMFTSRAEYRLLLRQDNADMRLMEHARQLGLVDDLRYRKFVDYRDRVEREVTRLKKTTIGISGIAPDLVERYTLDACKSGVQLAQFLARPEIGYADLAALGVADDALIPGEGESELELARVVDQIEIAVKYEGYIGRQRELVARNSKLEGTHLPPDLDYLAIVGLRAESAQKLQTMRPSTLGQASRIAGVNPTDISVLLVHLKARSAGGKQVA